MAKKQLKTFFIASLPRTRTAWLANLLTYERSFCFHEVLKLARTPKAIRVLFEGTRKDYVGDSDSGLPFFIDELMTEFPRSRLVVVERDPELVVRSLERVFSGTGANFREVVEKTTAAIARMKARYETLTVGFEELSDPKVCQKIWDYCVPGLPFDGTRWQMLNVLTVEIHPQKYLQSISPEAAQELDRRVKDFQI